MAGGVCVWGGGGRHSAGLFLTYATHRHTNAGKIIIFLALIIVKKIYLGVICLDRSAISALAIDAISPRYAPAKLYM